MRVFALPFALAALGGCSAAGNMAAPVTAETLAGTTWSEVCPDSNPERSYLRLEEGGAFAYNYDSPDDVEVDGGDRWRVEGTTLVISWNNDFAVTRYDLSAFATGALPGESTKSCGDRAVLERVSS